MEQTPQAKTDNGSIPSPLILIYSMRDRIRDILTVGLLQCHYRIIQAQNSHTASLKISQFMPDLVVIDITVNNTKDILLYNRFQNCERTREIPLLTIVPHLLKEKLEKVIFEKTEKTATNALLNFHIIEYPFSFATFLAKITTILGKRDKKISLESGKNSDEKQLLHCIEKYLLDIMVPVDQKLQKISSIIQKQWIFPFTIIKALDIIGSETSCCNELAKCIQSDLSASAAILKVANTVYYSKRQSRITEIKEAVVRLGFAQTRNLLSCFTLIDLSKNIKTQSGFTRVEFWIHSIATALIASKICTDCGYRKPELAFIAGLIHDLGKILLDNNFDELFPHLLEEAVSKIDSFWATEKRLMNFSHAEMGHFFTTQWNFPSSICLGILNHHNTAAIAATSTAADRLIQGAVFVANQIAKALNIGHSCDEIVQEIPIQILRELSMQKGPTDTFILSIIRQINRLVSYLGIPIKQLSMMQPPPDNQVASILFVYGSHPEFHPLLLALRNNGYLVKTAKQIPHERDVSIKVIISLPEPTMPLDIILDDDVSKNENEPSVLKIFVLDVDSRKLALGGFTDNTVVFINQEHLDVRFILHLLDKFFGQVVKPLEVSVDEDQDKATALPPAEPAS